MRAESTVVRHHFSAAVLQKVRPYQELDNWHGPLEILRHWSVIVVAAMGSIAVWQTLPLALSAPTYFIAVVLIGGRQRGLSGLLHQASHYTFMANRTANIAVATVAGGYPVLQSLGRYLASHGTMHHARFGSADDPDFEFFRKAGLYGKGKSVASLRSYVLGIFSPVSTLRYIAFLLRYRIWSSRADWREDVVRFFACALAVAAFAEAGALHIMVLYWLVPLVTAQAWIGSLAELLEHYPLMEDTPADPVRMSRNRDFGRLWCFLLGEDRGEGYHLVHHLFPRVPIWNLRHVHRELCADPDYAAQPVPRSPLQALWLMEAQLAVPALAGQPDAATAAGAVP